jgi:hypothetical protein
VASRRAAAVEVRLRLAAAPWASVEKAGLERPAVASEAQQWAGWLLPEALAWCLEAAALREPQAHFSDQAVSVHESRDAGSAHGSHAAASPGRRSALPVAWAAHAAELLPEARDGSEVPRPEAGPVVSVEQVAARHAEEVPAARHAELAVVAAVRHAEEAVAAVWAEAARPAAELAAVEVLRPAARVLAVLVLPSAAASAFRRDPVPPWPAPPSGEPSAHAMVCLQAAWR